MDTTLVIAKLRRVERRARDLAALLERPTSFTVLSEFSDGFTMLKMDMDYVDTLTASSRPR